jgi:hypothetical protein
MATSTFGNMNWLDPSYSIQQITDPAASQVNLSGLTDSLPGISASASTPAASNWFSSWLNNSGVLGQKLADGTQIQGWGMPAIGVASGLANAYFGAQQLGIAKDSLEQQKKAFQLNFDAQKKTTNAALADRQNARVASNPGAYASTADYMKQYGI